MSPLMNTYARLPVAFDRGEGAYLFAGDDCYLDLLSGIAVCGLGHCHPAVSEAISKQAQTLIHTANLYEIKNQTQLGKKLIELSGLEQAFFANSGAEANEAAIKIARKYGHNQQIDYPLIVVMEGSFHGRTMATLSATGNRKVQSGFEPLLSGFVRVSFNDVDAIAELAKSSPNIVAILVEPIQGEGGVQIPDADYLSNLHAICDTQNWLLMLDEVQTGMGRTGDWFCFQQSGIVPDVVTLAKGLGNGVPIGACLTNKKANVLAPGNHGSTFGGNFLASTAALATIKTIEKDNLCSRANELGKIFNDMLSAQLPKCTIRQKGLMIGVDLGVSCGELVGMALERKLLINVTADTVLRLLPPLILSDIEAKNAAQQVADLIVQFLSR